MALTASSRNDAVPVCLSCSARKTLNGTPRVGRDRIAIGICNLSRSKCIQFSTLKAGRVLNMSFEEVRRSRVDMGHRDGALGRRMEAEQQG